MSRNATFTCLFVVGCLVLALPVAAQPEQSPPTLARTFDNGCDVYVMSEGKLRFNEVGHLGNLKMTRLRTGEEARMVFECVDFPMEPESRVNGTQQSRSFCNWRLDGGGRGTNRAEVRWFPGSGGQLTFTVNAEVIRGDRYSSGGTYAQGTVDQAAGAIKLESFVAVYCRRSL